MLSSIIALLSTHYTYHSHANAVLRTLLLPQWSSKLNTYLSTTHNELLLVTLKLYNNLSAFAGGRERRAVFDMFPWELKVRRSHLFHSLLAEHGLVSAKTASHAAKIQGRRDRRYPGKARYVLSCVKDSSAYVIFAYRYTDTLCALSTVFCRSYDLECGESSLPRATS